MAFMETRIPKDVKKQQALDYALFEMASSYFKKAENPKQIVKEQMYLAWCENARQKQYEAEDIVLALLDNSPLAKETFKADEKVATVKIVKAHKGNHYACRFYGDGFDIEIEVNPKKNKPNDFELTFRDNLEDDL